MKTKAFLNPPKFTPSRDRKVDSLSEACPTCQAKPRVECQKLDGSGPAASRHPARRRMAVRRLNEALA